MVYQWITLAGAMVCLPLALVAWRARPHPGSNPLVVLMVSITGWNLAQFFATVATTVTWSIYWARLHYVGLTLIPPALFAVVLEYVGREELLTRRTTALLLVEPVLVNVLVWTESSHDLFVEHVPLDSPRVTESAVSELAATGIAPVDPGPLFWVHAGYSWLLAFVSLVVVVWLAIRRQRAYRAQLLLLATAIVVALSGSMLDNLLTMPLRLTEPSFVLTGLILTVAVSEFDLVNLTPVARATVLSELSSGVIVLDTDDRVVDSNPTARAFLGVDDDDELLGAHASDVFADVPDVYDRYTELEDGQETVELTTDGETRHYRVRVSPLTDSHDRVLGRVVLFDDITEQKARQAELERQNDQLEEFAGVVSHDLRNPIQVASGNVELAIDADDDERYLRNVEDSLDRMETIVDDVLTLARQGQQIDDREATDLHAVAARAWDTVDTDTASLENELTGTIQADSGRLAQVFENLFRNSVEHGGDTVTVRVGTLPDGFSLEDDGPGIPPDERDTVFETGYTSSDDGTGLGLGIVETVVEAHGWRVAVTESDTGGARFEISDVDFHTEGTDPSLRDGREETQELERGDGTS